MRIREGDPAGICFQARVHMISVLYHHAAEGMQLQRYQVSYSGRGISEVTYKKQLSLGM